MKWLTSKIPSHSLHFYILNSEIHILNYPRPKILMFQLLEGFMHYKIPDLRIKYIWLLNSNAKKTDDMIGNLFGVQVSLKLTILKFPGR